MWQADNNPDPSNTILRATGKLFTGNYMPELTTKNDGYTFIGNPYASPVDFEKMLTTANNISSTYYTYDPQVGRRGTYISYNATFDENSNSISKVDKYIQSGQAFFVQTNGGSPSIKFAESYKATGNTLVFRDPSRITKLSIQEFTV